MPNKNLDHIRGTLPSDAYRLASSGKEYMALREVMKQGEKKPELMEANDHGDNLY